MIKLENRKLRVGVDLAPLRPPLTGVGNYERHLLAALLSGPDAPQVHGFSELSWTKLEKDNTSWVSPMPESERIGDIRSWAIQQARRVLRTEMGRGAYSLLRHSAFELSCDAQKLSLFHAFAYVAPGNPRVPIIPVVYDLSFVRFPEAHPPARIQSLRALPKQLQAAPVVHTISHFSAREIADVFGIPLSRIAVIYPGVNHFFTGRPPEISDTALAHYKVTANEYFMTVSTLEPRKNLRSLIIAYSRLPRTKREQLPLCIVGADGWGSLDLPSSSQALERDGSLRFLGFVPNEHLRTLYTNTRAMFYPSVYEGFGMPIIEALACGARVICSDATAMPEASGDVARQVAPLDSDGWLREFELSAEIVDCGSQEINRRKRHAQKFTWTRAAEQVLELYQRATK
jgi:alpha-1,3-rhamnosyl/mannosyltransferase